GMEVRTVAPPRLAALAACLSLACWLGPAPAPLLPVAVIPFDAYGGAIYVPALINGDSVWLMLDTGLSRTGLDRDWARTVGIEPVPASSTAVVDTIRLGVVILRSPAVAIFHIHGLHIT